MSSKMNSVMREDERQRKGKKKEKIQGSKKETKEKVGEKKVVLGKKK